MINQTNANMPILSFNFSNTGLPFNENIDMFSANLVTNYAGSTNVSLFRTLMEASLWFSVYLLSGN